MKLFYRQTGPEFQHNGETVKPRALMHLCTHEGCDNWGAYLYGARWKDGVPGTAFCHEHRPADGNHVLTPCVHIETSPTKEGDDAKRNEPDLFSAGTDVGY